MNKIYQKSFSEEKNPVKHMFGLSCGLLFGRSLTGTVLHLPERSAACAAKAKKETLSACRKHMTRSSAGFTLIELLVVVLIIGILAAVALPRYEVAVMKSRFATLMPVVKALADAQELYFMENGTYADSFDVLSITPPAGGTVLGEFIQYDGFHCHLFMTNVYCSGNNYGYYSRSLQHGSDTPGESWCVVNTETDNADIKRKVCRSYGGTKKEPSVAEYEFWSMP